MYFAGNVTLTANQCTEPDQLFNSTVSVLPGSNITLTCSLVATDVSWNSSQFTMPIEVNGGQMTGAESGITLQLDTVSTSPTCSNATATVTNIQETMDGLDLTCYNVVPTQEFSSTVMFDVIGEWKFIDCLDCFWLTYSTCMVHSVAALFYVHVVWIATLLYSACENFMVRNMLTHVLTCKCSVDIILYRYIRREQCF